ncbi:hypothetical protein RchiOBHm_Chr6g0265471 [Rosa chinensis]|uniref:Uncharacterized protein n=1 Tax=Rosa chinensis TaxID=74649 RepID=A0A2P6PPE7_ROSCH|nr:uncharacterized protein LOC112174298 [Rosa chinensis]PRQ23808.1 hypothetical protein RchiOBHm_Chr6g0265471 [Rosa chinensis]
MNLESFTCVSKLSLFLGMVLNKSFKLSYVKIRAQHLKYLGVFGCHDTLKARINTPSLGHFDFQGYIKSRVCLSAPHLLMARIIIEDKQFSTFNGPWKHFSTLRDFLESFGCSKNITLSICDFKALIFPENFRRAFYPPLLGLKNLVLLTANFPSVEIESSSLKESLAWMSSSAVELIPISVL